MKIIEIIKSVIKDFKLTLKKVEDKENLDIQKDLLICDSKSNINKEELITDISNSKLNIKK